MSNVSESNVSEMTVKINADTSEVQSLFREFALSVAGNLFAIVNSSQIDNLNRDEVLAQISSLAHRLKESATEQQAAERPSSPAASAKL